MACKEQSLSKVHQHNLHEYQANQQIRQQNFQQAPNQALANLNMKKRTVNSLDNSTKKNLDDEELILLNALQGAQYKKPKTTSSLSRPSSPTTLVNLANNPFGFNFDGICSEDTNGFIDTALEVVEESKDISSMTSSEDAASKKLNNLEVAADAAVECMSFISKNVFKGNDSTRAVTSMKNSPQQQQHQNAPPSSSQDNQPGDVYDTEDGYDTDHNKKEQKNTATATIATTAHTTENPKVNSKRQERNAREKERSFRIAKKINEIRTQLSNGGVIVPKGTKSSVLTEAVNYIRMLQQHQQRAESERNQLLQQLQMTQNQLDAAFFVKQVVALQNGMSSSKVEINNGNSTSKDKRNDVSPWEIKKISDLDETEYRSIFLSSPVGMAIASLGGAFIDCNNLFCELSHYTKTEVCSMTIFNLTNRCDLHNAFMKISEMIKEQMQTATSSSASSRIILKGLMKNARDDLGLSVSLIRNLKTGAATCFCVVLVKNVTAVPAMVTDKKQEIPFPSEHAYTTG